ncbi:MAG: hypothetical protein K8T25_15095, partial [Planctomycetia bacterium]|nr:hypothetical protein [Planctomycetia bacterium]
ARGDRYASGVVGAWTGTCGVYIQTPQIAQVKKQLRFFPDAIGLCQCLRPGAAELPPQSLSISLGAADARFTD